jgi:hypothetical protein
VPLDDVEFRFGFRRLAIVDAKSNLVGQGRMKSLASSPRLIIPGHDPEVFVGFPTPGNGVARLDQCGGRQAVEGLAATPFWVFNQVSNLTCGTPGTTRSLEKTTTRFSGDDNRLETRTTYECKPWGDPTRT